MSLTSNFLIKNWYLKTYSEKTIVLWGNLYRTPNIYEHVKIHTSKISDIAIDENVLHISTANSIYKVRMEDHLNQLHDFRDALTLIGYDQDTINDLVQYKVDALSKDIQGIKNKYNLPANCIYLDIDTVKDYGLVKSYLFTNGIGSILGFDINSGTFQDTIEFFKGEPDDKDFIHLRYLPRGLNAVFHLWKTHVPVYIHNPGEFAIEVSARNNYHKIAPDGYIIVR